MNRLVPLAAATLATLIVAACAEPAPKYDVHRYVASVVADLGGGLVLGAPLSQNASKASSLRWEQHAGLVGTANPQGLFAQVRMYPGAEDRAAPAIDSSALVRAVELVSAVGGNVETIQFGLMRTFGGVPRRGCLVPEDPEVDMRDVQYWTAPNDAGGVAILQDWDDEPAAPTEQVLWSVLAWSGPFSATETLLGPFEPRACDGTNSAIAMPPMRATVAAVERIDRAFKDSIHASRRAVADVAQRELDNADVPDACMVPAPEGATSQHDYPGFSIELPSEFTLRDPERTNRRALYWGTEVYRFSAPDGATIEVKSGREAMIPHTVGGMVVAHCDKTISARNTHVELMRGGESGGKPRLLVHGYLFGPRSMAFEAEVSSQRRQRQLLRAINTIRINPQWGEASADAKATPNRNPPP